MIKKILIPVFLLFVLMQISYALEDFTVSSQSQSLNSCACGSVTELITIRNTGSVGNQYLVSLSGSLKDLASLSSTNFILKPNQMKELSLVVNTPCNLAGDSDLAVEVRTANLQKRIDYPVNIISCQNLVLTGLNVNRTTCDSTTEEFQFAIDNTGTFTEDYFIELEGQFEDWAEVEAGYRIPAQQTFDFSVNVTPDSLGNFTSDLIVRSSNTGLTGRLELALEVNVCYDYDLDFGRLGDKFKKQKELNYEVCQDVDTVVPVRVTNNLNKNNSLILSLTGPDWIQLSEDTLALEPKSDEIINLIVDVPRDDAGNFTANLNVQSEFDIEQTESLHFLVENCFSPSVNPDKLKVYYDTQEVILELTNTGNRTAGYLLELEGPKWIQLGQNDIAVEAGQTGSLTLFTSPDKENDAKGPYVLSILISPENGTVYTEQVDVNLVKQFVAITYINNLYNQYVAAYISYIVAGIIILVILVAVFGRGKRGKRRWRATKTETAKKAKPLKKARKFKWKKFRKPALGILVLILILGGLVAAYFYYPQFYKPGEEEKTDFVGSLIERTKNLASRTVHPLTFGEFTYKPEREEIDVDNLPPENLAGIQPIIIDKNKRFKIDLNTYFEDPDGEGLEFTSTDTENVEIKIKNGVATLIPDPEFVGEETVYFSAEDIRGDLVKSNEVLIVVQDVHTSMMEDTIQTYVFAYWYYYLIGIALAILVFVFVNYREKIFKFLEEEK